MKVLYLHTDVESSKDVRNTLQSMDFGIVEQEAPGGREGEQEYVAKLSAVIEEEKPDMVLSLRYFPVVSLVCQAAKVKYAAWIASAYDSGIYSCTLLNSCNYIFLADYALYEEFADGEFANMFYLPLGACEGWIDQIAETAKNKQCSREDLLMPQPVIARENLGYGPLSPDSPLKDAVKGYLEGCIACQHQLSGLPSMAGHLPPYVWQDLTNHFPVEIRGDSVETAARYYDSRFFHPLITSADRDIHLETIRKSPHFKNVQQNNAWDRGELLKKVVESKISLVITHRNWRKGIPQISWDVMAAGGFLLSNAQEDYFRLFPGKCPVLYVDERDMLSKAIFYLHHDGEREQLAKELSEETLTNHTCRRRLEELFSKI